jgi:hypothetical protein
LQYSSLTRCTTKGHAGSQVCRQRARIASPSVGVRSP